MVVCADGVTRTFYVWAYLGMFGEVEAIHYGNSAIIQDASGIINRSDLTPKPGTDTTTRRTIWRFAEDTVAAEVVIEPVNDTPLLEGENVIPFPRRH